MLEMSLLNRKERLKPVDVTMQVIAFKVRLSSVSIDDSQNELKIEM